MPESMTYRALADDTWTLDQHLLAMVVDQLAVANWQRSKDGSRGRNRPKPISPLAKNRGTRHGKTTRSPDEVIAHLRRLNPAQYEGR